MEPPNNNTHFVLVHGTHHGAWCWYKIRSLMEASGFKVTCLDLKSAGIDDSDPNKVLTFKDYNQPFIDFLSNLPENEKVIIVGHSAGGLSLTDAIHKFPQKIRMAIYVAATMFKHGASMDEDNSKDGDSDADRYRSVIDLEYGEGQDQPPTSATVKKEFLRDILYQMSPIEDFTLASMLIKPAPYRIFEDGKFEGGKDLDSVARVYIKTMKDNCIRPEEQEAMIRRWLPSAVYEMESDHSPFFSEPFSLFGLFVKATTSITPATEY